MIDRQKNSRQDACATDNQLHSGIHHRGYLPHVKSKTGMNFANASNVTKAITK
ncbi:MAG: hypothetical protein HW390_1604 [Candidatus Brocadiaceae bacterium]|nr:hypothetical protein [Candidatus Brocadiaceae bacterium]